MYLAESELLTSLTFRSTVQESLNDLWASGVQWGYMAEVICPPEEPVHRHPSLMVFSFLIVGTLTVCILGP